jgi:hypothetical protein
MNRPRRDSRQQNGITVRGPSQLTFATKSALSGSNRYLDKFFGLFGWHEDVETALVLANDAKVRRKRLSRGARIYAGTAPRLAENLDQFFRTPEEAARDEVPIALTPMHVRGYQPREKRREKAEVIKSKPRSLDKSVPHQEAPPGTAPVFREGGRGRSSEE